MTTQDAQAVTTALEGRFGGRAEAEEVAPGRFRFTLVSPAFSGVPQLTRQDDVWAAVDAALPTEQSLDITLILAFAPDEVQMVP
jgi:hypothetical protein